MEKLSLILWRERELLDTLLYRLEVEQLVLAGGRTHHLARAARDVESTLEDLRCTEVLRAVAADEAAADVGLAPNPALRALAEASPEPWRTMLLEHRQAFTTLSQKITEMAEANRDLITSGFRSARETLLAFGDGDTQGYSPDGSAVTSPAAASLVDWSL